MRICSSCGRENPDGQDFCECGEYLRWEPTGYMQAVSTEQVAAAAPVAPEGQAAPAAPPPPPPPPAAAAPPPPPPPAPAAPVDDYATHHSASAPPPPPSAPPPPPAAPPPPPAAPPPPPAAPPPPPPAAPPPPPAAPPPPPAAPPPPPPPPPPAPAAPAESYPPPVTAAAQAAPAPPPAPAPEPEPEAPLLATIAVRETDAESSTGEVVALSVDPGQRVQCIASIRNASQIVDNYDLTIEGLPTEWYSIYPATVYLVPFGTSGAYEQDVQIHVHPPRAPEAEARVWNLQLVAKSNAYQSTAATAQIVVEIRPYTEFEARPKPEKASGRKKVTYEVTVKNKANAPAAVALGLLDPESAVEWSYKDALLDVQPGQASTTKLEVKAPKKIWVGRPLERRLEVLARTGEEGDALLEEQGLEMEEEEVEEEYYEEGGFAEYDDEGNLIEGSEVPEDGAQKKRGKGKGKGKLGKFGPRVTKPRATGPKVAIGPSGVRLQGPRVAKPRVAKPRVPSKTFGLKDLQKKPPGLGGGGGAAAQPTGPLLPTQVIFRQKPYLPWWTPLLLLLLLLLALFFFFFLPKNVIVPDVTKSKSTLEAQQKLAEVELILNPNVEQIVNNKVAPGTIIGQAPKAGAKVKKNTAVAIQVATGDGTIAVPKIVGLTVPQADALLRKEKLTLGAVTPQTPEGPDLKAKIASQLPAEKTAVKEGAAVQAILETVGKGKGKGKGGAGGGGGGGGGAGKVIVPPIGENDTKAYAQVAAKEGLVPEQVNAFSDTAKPGVLFGTEPPGGTEVAAGSKVKMLVATGVPELAFDDSKNILFVDGFSGKRLPALAKSPSLEKDPAFSPDGTRIVYVAGRKLVLGIVDKPGQKLVDLTTDSEQFIDPAFAPTIEANILAANRIKSGDGDLCVGEVGAKGYERACIADKSFSTSRVVRWAPDGKAVYVFGAKLNQGAPTGTFGMVEYKTKKPFSPDAADYGKGKFVTDNSQVNKGAIDLDISPDGSKLAVVANFESDNFQLYLTKPGDFDLAEAKRHELIACKVRWRPDSLEMVIVQSENCSRAPVGQIFRVNARDPKKITSLKVGGDNPEFRPPALEEEE